MCVANGEVNPNNPCQRCDTNEQTTAWSAVADGQACGEGSCAGTCQKGSCKQAEQQCVAEDGCYALGADHPVSPCQQCVLVGNPATGNGVAGWKSKPAGTECVATFPIKGPGVCSTAPKGSPKDCIIDYASSIEVGLGGWMGCPQCLPQEIGLGPQHYVEIKPFSIDALEVSADLYAACLKAGGCEYEPSEDIKGDKGQCSILIDTTEGVTSYKLKGVFLPMNCVSRDEANQFCEWRGKTLCSEAQWERAAVGSCAMQGIPDDVCQKSSDAFKVSVYPWGVAWEFAELGPPICDHANTQGCEGEHVFPILTVDGPAFGESVFYPVWGLSGNVAEWVQDSYFGSYEDAPDNGTAWVDPLNPTGIVRGGGYEDPFPVYTTVYRQPFPKSARSPNVGFRCCSSDK